ncbi:MAG: hypothetical protein V3R80_07065 [Candidatus Tectomicrobia bacterium]
MARLSLNLAGYPWDHITPLLTGDVVPEGIDLQYDVHHGLGPVTDNPACAGGEASLGTYRNSKRTFLAPRWRSISSWCQRACRVPRAC